MGGSYVGSCIKGFSTREQLKEVEIFLKGRKGGGAKVSFLSLEKGWRGANLVYRSLRSSWSRAWILCGRKLAGLRGTERMLGRG